MQDNRHPKVEEFKMGSEDGKTLFDAYQIQFDEMLQPWDDLEDYEQLSWSWIAQTLLDKVNSR